VNQWDLLLAATLLFFSDQPHDPAIPICCRMADRQFPSSSASTSAYTSLYANTNYYVYDVFINHRGPDCKNTFATYLYKRLSEHGLRVFLDKQELQQGDSLTSQIEGAIRTASVHIAIFSPRYVQSSWCLNELLLMLGSGATIIPVFYGVRPSELRWTEGENGLCATLLRMLRWFLCMLCCTGGQTGVYARDLRMLQGKKTIDSQTGQQKPRYDSHTIGNWRMVLRLVII